MLPGHLRRCRPAEPESTTTTRAPGEVAVDRGQQRLKLPRRVVGDGDDRQRPRRQRRHAGHERRLGACHGADDAAKAGPRGGPVKSRRARSRPRRPIAAARAGSDRSVDQRSRGRAGVSGRVQQPAAVIDDLAPARRTRGRPPGARRRAPPAPRCPNGSRGAQCSRQVARASAARGSRARPASSTAPARSGCAARRAQPVDAARSRPSSAAPTSRSRSSGTRRRASATASSARSGRFHRPARRARATSGGGAGSTGAAKRSGVDPRVDDMQPAPEPPPRIELVAPRLRGDDHHAPRAGPPRGPPPRSAGRAGSRGAANDHRPAAAQRPAAGDRRPHPPGDDQLGVQVARRAGAAPGAWPASAAAARSRARAPRAQRAGCAAAATSTVSSRGAGGGGQRPRRGRRSATLRAAPAAQSSSTRSAPPRTPE